MLKFDNIKKLSASRDRVFKHLINALFFNKNTVKKDSLISYSQLLGLHKILTSFDLIGKIIIGGIFFAVGVNARLLIKILNKIKNNCTDVCQEQFKIDLIKGFKDIKATSFVIYIFITLVSFFVLFGQKTIKKISKKK